MKVDVYFTPLEVDRSSVPGSTALVVDVLRATSTIVEAMANGARAVYPTESTEDAVRLAESLGREDTLLCGERRGLAIEGFDLGNSPAEYTSHRVTGKTLVLTTTNGTRALLAVAGASRVIVASYLNLSAAARAAAPTDHLVIACAGKEDRFSLDDAFCAGLILEHLQLENPGEVRLNDGAQVAVGLAGGFVLSETLLARTAAGQALTSIGLGKDIAFCAQRDLHAVVPEMRDSVIRVSSPGS